MSDKSIELIFRTFSRRFSHRWTIAHDDKLARQLWWGDLNRARITDSDVQVGLKGCVSYKWPPSMGDFIGLCKQSKKPNYYVSLPRPPINKTLVKSHIDQMRLLIHKASIAKTSVQDKP